MLKFGEKSIKSLYYGDKAIKKAYLGEKLVFNKKPYYCEVEYLESTGTQYIDTGISANVNTIVEYTFSLTQVSSDGGLFGSGSSQSSTDRFQGYYENATGFSTKLASTTTFSNVTITANTKHYSKMGIPLKGYYIDDTFVSSATGTPANLNLYIFGRNIGGSFSNPTKMRLYGFKISENETLVSDFIPVLDFDMTPCLYDKVSGQLFYNQGSGEFLYGREIHEVGYLESTGTQYIDTDYIPNNNTNVEMVVSGITANSFGSTSGTWFLGGREAYLSNAFGSYYNPSNQTLYYAFGNNLPSAKYSSSSLYNNTLKIKLDKTGLYINDSKVVTATDTTFTAPVNLSLFGLNNNGTTISFTSFKMHSCPISENDVLIRDYIPAIDENGKGFMFDRVTHTIFDNAGTGDFITGGKV